MVAFLAGALVSFGFTRFVAKDASLNYRQTSVQPQRAASQVSPKPVTTSSKFSAIDRIFQFKMLGAQIAYLESFLGPAIRVNPDKSREYEVGDCHVTIFPAGESIDAMRLDLTKNCTFDVRRIGIGMDFPSANAMTFGAFAKQALGAKFLSDCLSFCGNLYDPDIYLYWQGPHAANWTEVLVGAPLTTAPILKASSKIEDVMRAGDGDNYITSTKFNCDTKYDQSAVGYLEDVPITFIEIGYHAKPDGLTCNTP